MVSVSPTPLLAVTLLFRAKPRFAGIDHVIRAVSAYADSSVELPLNKACNFGSVTLLDRIWSTTVDLEPGGWGLWSVRKLLRTYKVYGKLQFTLCLLVAVKINNVEVVRWLFNHFPDYGVRRKVIYEAASAGALEILQYFRANGTAISNEEEEQEEDGEWNEEKENWEKGRWVCWGGLDAAKAAIAGHADVVKWMYETYAQTCENRNDFCAIDAAFIAGDMELANWLMDKLDMSPEGHDALHGAAANGHVEPLQWFQERGEYTSWDAGTLFKAAEAGQWNAVRWIVDRDRNDSELGDQSGPEDVVDAAAGKGHLEIVQYLLQIGHEEEDTRKHKRQRVHESRDNVLRGSFSPSAKLRCTDVAMDVAAAHGHLDVVRWLHANRTEGCTKAAMDLAATNGHLDTVKWLHTHRSEGCTFEAMDGAASGGHLDVAKWLHQNRTEGYSRAAMDNAASGGHLEVLKWLDGKRARCSTAALDGAAAYGKLGIVKWLRKNRPEGCTTLAMDGAAHGGHLRVLRWLFENRKEGFTDRAMENAERHSQFETLLILHNIAQQGLAKEVEIMEEEESNAWISEHYLDIARAEFYPGSGIGW
ncbi:hypothetical protein PInf_008954 [Phytophthora infestans]|nr:hypothetical protein PInf_008856 [Phytophthora infestans]KAI9981299.1 hypothetical protein PInf_008954 [Phytophthora infestans]